jgi:hypothetical protein
MALMADSVAGASSFLSLQVGLLVYLALLAKPVFERTVF